MKASTLKTEKSRYTVTNVSQYDILAYGELNDYPQTVLDLVNASTTGRACLANYQKFIYGNGFQDHEAWNAQINRRGETLDDLLMQIARSIATFGGFALHLNFNRLYQITSINAIPFETVRLCMPDSKHDGMVALHPDWGKRQTKRKAFAQKDIEYYPLYDRATIQSLIDDCPNMAAFAGAVYYYSNTGSRNYPLPIFDCALTDMNTEEAISNITNRNAKNGFLPAGMIVDICSGSEDTEEAENTKEVIQSLTGDTNANKVIYTQVASESEIPRFVKFDIQNFDREFSVSRQAASDSIGRAFNQPPMLRAEKMASGFSEDIMEQAFRFYNAVTRSERLLIERLLTNLLSNLRNRPNGNYSIQPLCY